MGIFVEATMQGVKYNDIRRKYASLYESKYMRGKLEALFQVIVDIVGPPDRRGTLHHSSTIGSLLGTQSGTHASDYPTISLKETDFHKVLSQRKVIALLDDLDVSIDNPQVVFSAFDTDDEGRVSLPEMIHTLMKLRGELSKSDIVGTWASLKAFQDKFQEFQYVV